MIPSKLSVVSHRTALTFCMLIAASGCSKTNWQETPVRISPTKPLVASLGQDIEWSFEATRGSRKLRILEITYNNVPLGVVRTNGSKGFVIKGKALTRDIRSGLIKVTAFDEKACDDGYEQMKKLATEEVKATGNTNMAIPLSPCKLSRASDYSNASSYMAQGYFSWHLNDGADNLAPEKYQAFVAENLLKSTRPLPDGMMTIPQYEAPHTNDVILGACAALPRTQCGKDPACLWGLSSCISKDATGRKSLGETRGAAAEADIVIAPEGGVKR